VCQKSYPPYSPWFDLPNHIWEWVQNMKLLIVQLPSFSCHFIPLWSKYSLTLPHKEYWLLYIKMKWMRFNIVLQEHFSEISEHIFIETLSVLDWNWKARKIHCVLRSPWWFIKYWLPSVNWIHIWDI
jgi:hypothetical protein